MRQAGVRHRPAEGDEMGGPAGTISFHDCASGRYFPYCPCHRSSAAFYRDFAARATVEYSVITRSLRSWSTLPEFEDEEHAQRAGIFQRVVLTTMGFATPALALIAVVQHTVWERAI